MGVELKGSEMPMVGIFEKPRLRWQELSAWEVGLVAGLIAATIWLAPLLSRHSHTARLIGAGFAASIALVVISSEVVHKERLADLGFRFDNLSRALALLAIPTVVLAGVMVGIGTWLGSLRLNAHTVAAIHWDWYGWLLIQQYLLNSFLNRRLQDVCGKGSFSILFTAIFFAAFHLPNPALMLATLIAGYVWAWVFQRTPNLFALALSHLILSFVLSHTMPPWVLPNAKVGWAFHW